MLGTATAAARAGTAAGFTVGSPTSTTPHRTARTTGHPARNRTATPADRHPA
ncbi:MULTISPECIES: hypothetical protein [unclassified Streptomyces]|uniref:hypothetical protein n=1 Tax=unclassified Streptomyces TaxID=2593676 RepID=UPI00380179C0